MAGVINSAIQGLITLKEKRNGQNTNTKEASALKLKHYPDKKMILTFG